MMETQESSRSRAGNHMNSEFVRGPPRKYEKLIEKLESDVRGHIRVSVNCLMFILLFIISLCHSWNMR